MKLKRNLKKGCPLSLFIFMFILTFFNTQFSFAGRMKGQICHNHYSKSTACKLISRISDTHRWTKAILKRRANSHWYKLDLKERGGLHIKVEVDDSYRGDFNRVTRGYLISETSGVTLKFNTFIIGYA